MAETTPTQSVSPQEQEKQEWEHLEWELSYYCKPLKRIVEHYGEFLELVDGSLKPYVRLNLPKESPAALYFYLYGYLIFGKAWSYAGEVDKELREHLTAVAEDTDEYFRELKLESVRDIVPLCKQLSEAKVGEWGRLGEIVSKLASKDFKKFVDSLETDAERFWYSRIWKKAKEASEMDLEKFQYSGMWKELFYELKRLYLREDYLRYREALIEFMTYAPPFADIFKKNIVLLLKLKNYSNEEIEKVLGCIRGCKEEEEEEEEEDEW